METECHSYRYIVAQGYSLFQEWPNAIQWPLSDNWKHVYESTLSIYNLWYGILINIYDILIQWVTLSFGLFH